MVTALICGLDRTRNNSGIGPFSVTTPRHNSSIWHAIGLHSSVRLVAAVAFFLHEIPCSSEACGVLAFAYGVTQAMPNNNSPTFARTRPLHIVRWRYRLV